MDRFGIWYVTLMQLYRVQGGSNIGAENGSGHDTEQDNVHDTLMLTMAQKYVMMNTDSGNTCHTATGNTHTLIVFISTKVLRNNWRINGGRVMALTIAPGPSVLRSKRLEKTKHPRKVLFIVNSINGM